MGISENMEAKHSTLNTRILIIRTPKWGTLIFGNSHIYGLGLEETRHVGSHRSGRNSLNDFLWHIAHVREGLVCGLGLSAETCTTSYRLPTRRVRGVGFRALVRVLVFLGPGAPTV